MYGPFTHPMARQQDLLRAAERHRLAAFISCCRPSLLAQAFRRMTQAVAARWQQRSSASIESVCCAA